MLKRRPTLTQPARRVNASGDTPPVTNATPLVSVIIPAYNASETIRQCLGSVLRQDYSNLEVICINDGSTDDTLNVMRGVGEEYCAAGAGHQLIIVDKQNAGYGAGVNTGLDAASGEYISIVESDDWLEQSFYSDVIAYRNKLNIDADIIKTPYNRVIRDTVDADPVTASKVNCSYKTLIPENKSLRCVDTPQFMLHHPSIWSAIYRKDFLVSNGIRVNEEPGAAWVDNPFLYETLLLAGSIIYLDKPYYNYVEDLPEEERAFYRRNPSVPFTRFLEVNDIIHSLSKCMNIPDYIWLAHYKRGFNYIDYIQQGSSDDGSDGDANKYINDIISVTPPIMVLLNEELAPQQKQFYFSRRSELIEAINVNAGGVSSEQSETKTGTRDVSPVILISKDKQRFIRYLIKQGIYRLRITSFGFTMKTTKTFLKKFFKNSAQ